MAIGNKKMQVQFLPGFFPNLNACVEALNFITCKSKYLIHVCTATLL